MYQNEISNRSKKRFERPQMEMILFDKEDILTVSGGDIPPAFVPDENELPIL